MARKKRAGTTYFGMEIPDADYQFLFDTAKAEDRSMASLLRRIFKEWIGAEKERRVAAKQAKSAGRGD